MQKTTNYQLPKWEKTDRIRMDDFNGMTGALDTTLHGVAVSAEAAQAAADREAADRQAADAAEATARENAVTAERASCSAALSAEITARINAVAAEATERANADAALQSAINGKAASSHVHAQSDVAGLTAALPKIAVGAYVGTGAYGQSNANTLTLDFAPKAALICKQTMHNAVNAYMFLVSGQSQTAQFNSNGGGDFSYCNWSGNTVSWYSTYKAASQLNEDGVSYCYVAWG